MINKRNFSIFTVFLYLISCEGAENQKKEKNRISTAKEINDNSIVQKKVSKKKSKLNSKSDINSKLKALGDDFNNKDRIKAPNFVLADLDGQVVDSRKFDGQVIMLTFWGTWCGPCRKEIPDFIKLYQQYNTQGLEIIGIAIQSGNPEDIKRFSDYYDINYPILTDINGNESFKAFSDYGTVSGLGTRAVPTTFLIDREGYIVKTYRGARPGHVFANDFKPLL